MSPRPFKSLLTALAVLLTVVLLFAGGTSSVVIAQQPTGSVPTVTGTPAGPTIIVTSGEGYIRVRGGPSTFFYDPIGVLFDGQIAPALGRSPGGDWIQIVYPGVPGGIGWVYAPLVTLSPGATLRIVEPPPTATPLATPTIDPTLAAAFIVPLTPTRLPTFTPAPPLVVPTFTDEAAGGGGGRIPMGLVIFILAFIGLLGAAISFLRR